ncbi:MAG: hypothetical protein IJS14_07230 [Lentisphaeria bacterium]|nr:hypothetical protein [Lentisphaeria bacterium]
MKKSHFFRWFNLIEVTMAVAVVGIGIAGVIALFPPAIEANKNADFQNFTGTVVNNVAAYLNYQLKRNWDGFTARLSTSKSESLTQQTNTEEWTEIPNFNGLFYATADQKTFGIRTQDKSIAAHVQMWKDDANLSKGHYDQTEVSLSSDNRTRIIVELSWPIHVAYADREKQEFIYEFNKP